MADTSLRYANQAFQTASGAVIAKGEIRPSSDALVSSHPGFWTTIDNANSEFSQGKWALLRIEG